MFSLNLLGFYRVLVSANKKEPFSGYHLLFFYDFFADFMEFNSFLGQCCVGRVLSQSYWVLPSCIGKTGFSVIVALAKFSLDVTGFYRVCSVVLIEF